MNSYNNNRNNTGTVHTQCGVAAVLCRQEICLNYQVPWTGSTLYVSLTSRRNILMTFRKTFADSWLYHEFLWDDYWLSSCLHN